MIPRSEYPTPQDGLGFRRFNTTNYHCSNMRLFNGGSVDSNV